MPQGLLDAVVFHRVRHVVRDGLDLVAGVAHGHAHAGVLQHVHVVLTVAEGHDLGAVYAVLPDVFFDAGGFSAALGNDVDAGLVPACDRALIQQPVQQLLLLLRHKGDDLIHLLALVFADLRDGALRLRLGPDYGAVHIVDVALILTDEHKGDAFCLENTREHLHFPRIDTGSGVGLAVGIQDQLTVEGQIGVKVDVAYREGGILDHMPPCGDDGLYPPLPELRQRPAGAVRDRIQLVGEQSPVHVKEDRLDTTIHNGCILSQKVRVSTFGSSSARCLAAFSISARPSRVA